MIALITFTKVKLPYGWLSNMAPFPITYLGSVYPTSEALFQARRFPFGHPARELIRTQKSPMTAKMIAGKYAQEVEITPQSPEDLFLMQDVLRIKTLAYPELKMLLYETGTSEIIEDCTNRQRGSGLFWGAGLQSDGTWKGENHLGRLWMSLRTEFNEIYGS